MNCFTIALASQTAFVIWFLITHFISLPPLNDLSKEAFAGEHRVNFFLLCLWALGVYGFYSRVPWHMWVAAIFCWTITMIGHIMSWWLPYFFGWPAVFLEDAVEDNKRTYHFLPARGNHPIPDLNHCIIGILLTTAFISTWCTLL